MVKILNWLFTLSESHHSYILNFTLLNFVGLLYHLAGTKRRRPALVKRKWRQERREAGVQQLAWAAVLASEEGKGLEGEGGVVGGYSAGGCQLGMDSPSAHTCHQRAQLGPAGSGAHLHLHPGRWDVGPVTRGRSVWLLGGTVASGQDEGQALNHCQPLNPPSLGEQGAEPRGGLLPVLSALGGSGWPWGQVWPAALPAVLFKGVDDTFVSICL